MNRVVVYIWPALPSEKVWNNMTILFPILSLFQLNSMLKYVKDFQARKRQYSKSILFLFFYQHCLVQTGWSKFVGARHTQSESGTILLFRECTDLKCQKQILEAFAIIGIWGCRQFVILNAIIIGSLFLKDDSLLIHKASSVLTTYRVIKDIGHLLGVQYWIWYRSSKIHI